MSEDMGKKGHIKFTIDVEINEEFMSVIKESMTKMPDMMWKMNKMREKWMEGGEKQQQ